MNLKDAVGWKLSNGKPLENAEDDGRTVTMWSRETQPVMTMGSPNPRSFAQGKRGIAGDATLEKLYGRSMKVGNHTQSYDVDKTPDFLGMRVIPLDYPHQSLIKNTLMVMRNGEGIDYMVDEAQNAIVLHWPNASNDNDLEIRYQYDMTENYRLRGVVLFPRKIGEYHFTDDMLKDLMPSSTDTFDAEKLMRYGNKELIKYKNQKLLVEHVKIAEEGIVATIRAEQ